MNETVQKLLFHLERSQSAYKLYLENKYFHCALRIFNANKDVHSIIVNNANLWNGSIKEEMISFLFHLEDWFKQFELKVQKDEPNLEDYFVFERLKTSVAFPIGITESLKKIII